MLDVVLVYVYMCKSAILLSPSHTHGPAMLSWNPTLKEGSALHRMCTSLCLICCSAPDHLNALSTDQGEMVTYLLVRLKKTALGTCSVGFDDSSMIADRISPAQGATFSREALLSSPQYKKALERLAAAKSSLVIEVCKHACLCACVCKPVR